MKRKNNRGFTLIEILIVISLIAILATVVLVAINPGRQFAQARNSQRLSNINSILNAINQNMADNKGIFKCASVATLPAAATNIESAGADLRSCIVPTYLGELPIDPSTGLFTSASDYSTKYSISQDATTKRITIEALDAELSEKISVTR
ncbi:MAG: type II secretion system GspH family protein [bacterium]|nr:type II secretion system GspH family protein [bacterium]